MSDINAAIGLKYCRDFVQAIPFGLFGDPLCTDSSQPPITARAIKSLW